jgi:hypothetical protein
MFPVEIGRIETRYHSLKIGLSLITGYVQGFHGELSHQYLPDEEMT